MYAILFKLNWFSPVIRKRKCLFCYYKSRLCYWHIRRDTVYAYIFSFRSLSVWMQTKTYSWRYPGSSHIISKHTKEKKDRLNTSLWTADEIYDINDKVVSLYSNRTIELPIKCIVIRQSLYLLLHLTLLSFLLNVINRSNRSNRSIKKQISKSSFWW